MADRRYDDDRRVQEDRRQDPDRERRIQRRADIYRGSDERGYGGGERLGREWERGDPGAEERFDRDMRVRSHDEERFDRGGRGDERRYAELDRARWDRDERDLDREDRRASPSGAFHEELREARERPRRYGDRTRPTSLQHDTDRWSHGAYGLGAGQPGETGGGRDHQRYGGDVGRSGPERGRYGSGTRGVGEETERGERYDERRRQRDYQPRYGHGPGVENMEPPRLGYSTSTTRGDDHEMGHGGFLGGGTYRSGAPKPTGRAPKGYTRSDERIRDDIFDHLMMSWMDAENVDIQVRDGEVTLQGTVRSRDEKRAIEALADSIPGVKDIINELRVPRGDQEIERRSEDSEQRAPKPSGNEPLHS